MIAPEAVVIAGPNGAGKTTFARRYLPVQYPGIEFLNAEEIQREGGAFLHRVSAGRELIRRLSTLEDARRDFAIEVTLSSRRFADRFRRWADFGYRISLHFIELPSPELAVRRVNARVGLGGHAVPEHDIRRRFQRGLLNFHEVYKAVSDEWYHW